MEKDGGKTRETEKSVNGVKEQEGFPKTSLLISMINPYLSVKMELIAPQYAPYFPNNRNLS